MSDTDSNKFIHMNDVNEKSETDGMLPETEGVTRIRRKGEGKTNSRGSGSESDYHSRDLHEDASGLGGEMTTGSSGRRPTQGESSIVHKDTEVGRGCDGGDTNPESQEPAGASPATVEEGQQVPDGGWGWLVAIGTYIITALTLSVTVCFGILFSGFLLEMGTSSTTIAWIFNIQWVLWYFVTPLIHPLTKEFGWRSVGYIGVLMSSSSIILSAFSPSAEFLFFSYSLLTGCGGGLVVGVAFLILPLYFDRRRGLSNTFLVSGICTAQILIAPYVRYLVDNYSYKGAALIYGATLLNAFVAVSLFHPVQWHMKKPRPKIDLPPERLASLKPQKESSDGSQEQMNYMDKSSQHKGTNEETACVAVTDGGRVKQTSCNTSHRSSWCSQHSVILDYATPGITVPDTVCTPPDSRKGSRDFAYSGVTKRLWMVAVRVAQTTLSDLRILHSRRALVVSTANAVTVNSFFNFLMLVPFAMKAEGHSLQDTAWCISVMGICNLVTRLIISPLADWKRFNMRLCLLFGYVVMASSMLVFSLSTNLVWITVALAAFGYSLGATVTFHVLSIIEYMGIEHMAATFGVSCLMTGCGFLFVGPFTGVIRDKSGSYAISIWMLAAMILLVITLWLIMPVAVASDNRKRQREILQGV